MLWVEPRSSTRPIHAFARHRCLGACVLVSQRKGHCNASEKLTAFKPSISEPQGRIFQGYLGSGKLEGCREAIHIDNRGTRRFPVLTTSCSILYVALNCTRMCLHLPIIHSCVRVQYPTIRTRVSILSLSTTLRLH